MLFFREFRPIDSQQSSSHLFHPSTAEILLDGGVSACGLWLVFVWLVVGFSLSYSPPSDCISPPSMMTWAPCPHGVRTRGKKRLLHISQTSIQEIVGGTFAQCPYLQCPKLTKNLRRIGREAFRSALEIIHTPPNLLCINKRAFAGCTQLCKLIRMGKKGTWRGIHVERNTFEMCTD